MRKLSHRTISFISFVILFTAGCKPGHPDVGQLKTLEGFQLDQTVIPVSSKTTPAFSITGQCDPKYHDIEVSTDAGLTWKKVGEFAASYRVACGETSTFAASFDFTNHALDPAKWNAAGSFNEISLRGYSESFGYSAPQKLRLESQTYANLKSLSAGGGNRVSLSGNYRLADQVMLNGTSATASASGRYKIEGAVSW